MIEINKIYNIDALELLKQIDDNSIDLVLTDPPYNISSMKGYKFNDFTKHKELYQEYYRVLRQKKFLVFTIRLSEGFKIYNYIVEAGFEFYRDLFWKKPELSDFLNPLPYSHENILVFRKGTVKPNKVEYKGQAYSSHSEGVSNSVWEPHFKRSFVNKATRKSGTFIDLRKEYIIDAPSKRYMKITERTVHPTQKPLKLFRILLAHFSNEGDLVLDPFMGSGTTAVACKQLGRNYIGSEINKKYYRIAVDRLKQETLKVM